MPNLFPEKPLDFEEDITEVLDRPDIDLDEFKGTYEFDFEKGEFQVLQNGAVKVCDKIKAYKQWCIKALSTARYRREAYDESYGQEYREILGSSLPQDVLKSEVERVTRETLMVHPFTSEVRNFIFTRKERDTGSFFIDFDIETIFGDDMVNIKYTWSERGD